MTRKEKLYEINPFNVFGFEEALEVCNEIYDDFASRICGNCSTFGVVSISGYNDIGCPELGIHAPKTFGCVNFKRNITIGIS